MVKKPNKPKPNPLPTPTNKTQSIQVSEIFRASFGGVGASTFFLFLFSPFPFFLFLLFFSLFSLSSLFFLLSSLFFFPFLSPPRPPPPPPPFFFFYFAFFCPAMEFFHCGTATIQKKSSQCFLSVFDVTRRAIPGTIWHFHPCACVTLPLFPAAHRLSAMIIF